MTLAAEPLWNEPSYWSEPAEQAFQRARRRGRREQIWCRLRGCRADLDSFDRVRRKSGVLAESVTLNRSVPLSAIVGSVDGGEGFTRSFWPASKDVLPRWKRAFAVAHGLRGYEPIDLYEVEGKFYVVDGHHRLSVARALGFETIQARVRRWS